MLKSEKKKPWDRINKFAHDVRNGKLSEQEWVCRQGATTQKETWWVEWRRDSSRNLEFVFCRNLMVQARGHSPTNVCPLCENKKTRAIDPNTPQGRTKRECSTCGLRFDRPAG